MARRKKSGGAAASLNPDNMASAGLLDDFDGTITRARFVPYDYNGNIDEYVLAVAITIDPDDEDTITEYYSAGNLDFFAPSEDGEEPVDLDGWDEEDVEEVEGRYAVKVGKRDALNNNTNLAHFIRASADAGFEGSFDEGDISVLEGIYGRFNRVAQQKRPGIAEEAEEGNRQRTTLVLTEVKSGGGSKKSSAKKKTSSRRKKASDSGGDDDLAAEVTSALVDALEANDGELSKRQISGTMVKAFSKNKPKKAKAMKMAGDIEFLSGSDEWEYDEDDNVIYIPED